MSRRPTNGVSDAAAAATGAAAAAAAVPGKGHGDKVTTSLPSDTFQSRRMAGSICPIEDADLAATAAAALSSSRWNATARQCNGI